RREFTAPIAAAVDRRRADRLRVAHSGRMHARGRSEDLNRRRQNPVVRSEACGGRGIFVYTRNFAWSQKKSRCPLVSWRSRKSRPVAVRPVAQSGALSTDARQAYRKPSE